MDGARPSGTEALSAPIGGRFRPSDRSPMLRTGVVPVRWLVVHPMLNPDTCQD